MVSLRLVSMILLVGACGGAGVRYQALGQGRVVVAGAQTDACIRATLHGAFVRGYDTVLVGDAHTTEDFSQYGLPPADKVIAHTNMYWTWQTEVHHGERVGLIGGCPAQRTATLHGSTHRRGQPSTHSPVFGSSRRCSSCSRTFQSSCRSLLHTNRSFVRVPQVSRSSSS